MSLKNVSVGDRLIVESFGRGATYKVERLTPTQAVCENDTRFNLETGGRVGAHDGSWGRSYARKMVEADFVKERIHIAQRKLERFPVTVDNLEVVEALVGIKK